MDITAEEYRAMLEGKKAEIEEKIHKSDEAIHLKQEVDDLVPEDLRSEYVTRREEVEEAREKVEDAKNDYKEAVVFLKDVGSRIGAILNGDQMKLFLSGATVVPVKTGSTKRGKQGQRIKELLAGGAVERKALVEQLKEEFNGADGHGAFDSLRKKGEIIIEEGVVSLA